MDNISTLRPGLLVSLKTSVTGNVSYFKKTIEADHVTPTGEALAIWETERKIADPEEHERACTARNAASHAIRVVCSKSAFGLLCPEEKSAKLDTAIAEARQIASEFNATAKMTQLGVYVVCGRVAQDDVEAVRAINSEVRDLIADMETGLRNLDVKAVRAAAQKAKGLGQMLSDNVSDKIKDAIETARKSARQIVKAGEGVAVEVDLVAIKQTRTVSRRLLGLVRRRVRSRVADWHWPDARSLACCVSLLSGAYGRRHSALALVACTRRHTHNGANQMPCDTRMLPQQTLTQRKEEIKSTVEKLAAKLVSGQVKAKVGPQGAITFIGWTENNRVTDACAYRRIMSTGTASAKLAIMKAEQLAGVKVNKQAVAHGHHSHDGGKTWHHGH